MSLGYYMYPQNLSLSAVTELVNKVSSGSGIYTNKEMMCLPEGTHVRIKSTVDTKDDWKKGGALIFQTLKELEDRQYLFGILVEGMCSFSFKASDYEVVALEKHPIWLKKFPLRKEPY